MKKVYMTPEVEEIDMELGAALLAGSDPQTDNGENNSDDIEDL